MKGVGSSFVQFQRDDLIKNAVEFLQEPHISKAPEDKKRNFLKTKGMTDDEIDTAFRMAVSSNVGTYAPVTSDSALLSTPTQAQSNLTPRTTAMALMPSQAPAVLAPWKSIVFVVFVCVGIGKAIFVLVKKYLIPLFWKRKKSETKEKILAVQEELKSQIITISNLVSGQSKEILTTLGLIDLFKSGQEWKDKILEGEKDSPNSGIQKEIQNLKLVLKSTHASPYERNDSPFSTQYSDLLAEVVAIKRAILDATGTKGTSPQLGSVKTNQDALIDSQRVTVPWKIEKQNSKPMPGWLSTKPKLDWLYQSKTEKETKQAPPTEGTGVDGPTPPVEGVPTVGGVPVVGSDYRHFNRKEKSNEINGGLPSTIKSHYSGDMDKMRAAAQKRKETPNSGGDDPFGYSDAFLKMTQAVAKLPPNMKPEDFPGVKKIDDSPLEQF